MSNENVKRDHAEKIVRAWKDEEYRASLSEAERALLPDHPAGHYELSDADLASIAGSGCANCLTDPRPTRDV
jgi:mersacidin/lichenicidin family type 2 lantibiotic